MEFRCLCLCGEMQEPALRQCMEQFVRQKHQPLIAEWYRRREDLLYRTRSGSYDLVVVALPGALGMEAVLGVREQAPDIALIWCSDDDVFALQSYRLRVTTFLKLPPCTEKMVEALEKCTRLQQNKGNFYNE